MLWGVVDLLFVDQTTGFFGRKGLVQRRGFVSVEVVLHQDDFLGGGMHLKRLVLEEHTVESRLLLDENFELFAPHPLFAEFGNIVWKKFARGELTRDEVVDRRNALLSVRLQVASERLLFSRAIESACRLNHPAYDCFYLALADSFESSVVTADQRFANKVADPARVVLVADFLKA